MPTRLVCRGESEQVVTREQWLQDHVVERERERRAENDERALRALERQLAPRSERDHDRHAAECDCKPDDARDSEAVEP